MQRSVAHQQPAAHVGGANLGGDDSLDHARRLQLQRAVGQQPRARRRRLQPQQQRGARLGGGACTNARSWRPGVGERARAIGGAVAVVVRRHQLGVGKPERRHEQRVTRAQVDDGASDLRLHNAGRVRTEQVHGASR